MNLDFSAIALRDYGKSLGWKLVPEALKDQLFVLNSPKEDFTQLVFPVDETESKFKEMAYSSLLGLVEFTGKSPQLLADEIREVNEDVICFRFYSENKVVNSLPFEEAIEAIESAKQLILAAGSSVVNPSLFHPKLNRSEPKELLKKTRFRHTHEGSFILRVSCPFEGVIDNQTALFDQDTHRIPFSRKAFALMNVATEKIHEVVQADTIANWVEEERRSDSPIISYNFCDALLGLFDAENELPIEIRFQWSRNSIKDGFPIPSSSQAIRFPYSSKEKMLDIRQRIKPAPRELSQNEFIGSVEILNGVEGDDGRSGEVVLSLFVDGESVKARANLNVDQYKTAHEAHIKSGGQGYLKIKGTLTPGSRIRVLENILEFQAANI